VVFAGGVAQNIKACKAVAELDGLEGIYVPPAAGDTSLPIGACYLAAWERLRAAGEDVSALKPLDNLYLGPEFSRDDAQRALAGWDARGAFEVHETTTPADVAQRLADGQIIARSAGGMEFGLRALGNRSILADPRRAETVRRINDAIKFRDFWMPFTPTLLAERANDYNVNPKGLDSAYMTMAFDTTELARDELIAALHPADLTARPQLLEERRNPGYYAILKEFERLTGVGGVLNTSFNLHGDAIALGPDEALYTLARSELDALLLGDMLVTRR
jgi:carbamoyltransferase